MFYRFDLQDLAEEYLRVRPSSQTKFESQVQELILPDETKISLNETPQRACEMLFSESLSLQ